MCPSIFITLNKRKYISNVIFCLDAYCRDDAITISLVLGCVRSCLETNIDVIHLWPCDMLRMKTTIHAGLVYIVIAYE